MDKILFTLAILYKSLHMVMGNGGFNETGRKPRLLIFSSPEILRLRIWPLSGGG